ncbi:glycine cleavage system aminomethyltransferase GcvT [Allosphingosinicella sp.]|uniref:glycine cleavage system aminomethyltransferase GcvT n=1 Tax=Allosphingosinicella sp. TaxID=2823234 RepID=UPI002FC240FE
MSDPLDKKLPLDSWHRAKGARMVSFADYAMPIQYEGILAEHLWTRASAGLFDVSHMGQMELHGTDLDAALETVLPADLSLLKGGRLRYSLLLNDEGGIIDDLMVTRRGDHFYLVVNGATKHGDIAHLRHKLPVGIKLDHLEDHALLALQGPKAVDVLSRLAPGVEALSFMTGAAFQIDGARAWISRSGYTGEDGFEISILARDAETVAESIAAQAEVKPIGLGARDSMRLEAGLPLYGHDLDEETTPIEADLGFAISKRRREEGGFPGDERIQRELKHGPIRRRVGLAVLGRQPVREGAMVVDVDGDEVGKVTSGGFSPCLEAPIAMAYVPTASAEPGTDIRLASRGKIFEAKVVAMPFVPHRYHRKGAAK